MKHMKNWEFKMDFEYKIIRGTAEHCQKVLNQWRHQYHLTILHMSKVNDIVNVTILLERIEP